MSSSTTSASILPDQVYGEEAVAPASASKSKVKRRSSKDDAADEGCWLSGDSDDCSTGAVCGDDPYGREMSRLLRSLHALEKSRLSTRRRRERGMTGLAASQRRRFLAAHNIRPEFFCQESTALVGAAARKAPASASAGRAERKRLERKKFQDGHRRKDRRSQGRKDFRHFSSHIRPFPTLGVVVSTPLLPRSLSARRIPRVTKTSFCRTKEQRRGIW